MSDMSNPAMTDKAAIRFPSFASLRATHNTLLKRHRESGNTPEFLAEVEAFIQRGQATGALLDAEDDRWASQSLLDYWSAMMHRVGHEPPDATLAEFDPALAPELDDALCPYLGLDAFDEVNHDVFFGRQRLVGETIGRLKESRLLAVVGASGSGKSSLVRAGLLPTLKAGALPGSQKWHYYPPMMPGSTPLTNLIRLIQPSDADETEPVQHHVNRFRQDPGHLLHLIDELHQVPVVLVVDQFEELFTLCGDDAVRQAFVDNLLALLQAPDASHIVILTMRIDFEPNVARLPRLQPLFEQAQVRVTPLSANELRQAIERPAQVVGLKFEEGVVDALLRDILGEPAALPLLQFTLLKLWENRERNRVTWEAYRQLGGGRQALAHSADQFYRELIPEEQVTAKRILLRMVRPGEGLEVTSNRIRRETLYQAGEARDRIDRVLDKLVQARLVRLTGGDTPADAQVEVAHEALVRNWPRLVDWLEEERENVRQRLRLTAAAGQWAALGKDPEVLLRGALLDQALRYEDLNELEAEFVQASQAAVEEARRKEEEARHRELEQAQRLAEEQRRRAEVEHQRAEEQARAARRLRLLLAALAALFLLAVGAAVVVVKQTQENAQLAAQANAAATKALADAELVAALDAQATAVAQLATAEMRGVQILGAQETAQASQATAVAARETVQATALDFDWSVDESSLRIVTEAGVEEWMASVVIEPWGGDGNYTYFWQGEKVEQRFEIRSRACASVTGEITVASRDGQRTTKPLRVEALYCNKPTPIPTLTPTPTFTPVPTPTPTTAPTPTPTATATRAPSIVFVIEGLGCQTHGSTLGSVKGQVFDSTGDVIQGAQVEIWIDGARWNNPANPARTNEDGWYEWTLGLDQTIRFVALYVDGRQMTIDPEGFEVKTQTGCFQHVNFRQKDSERP
jgi:hypothetical protein